MKKLPLARILLVVVAIALDASPVVAQSNVARDFIKWTVSGGDSMYVSRTPLSTTLGKSGGLSWGLWTFGMYRHGLFSTALLFLDCDHHQFTMLPTGKRSDAVMHAQLASAKWTSNYDDELMFQVDNDVCTISGAEIRSGKLSSGPP